MAVKLKRKKRNKPRQKQQAAGPGSMAGRFQAAVRYHQAGQLDRAQKIYQKILNVNPQQPDCLHLMGVIAHQRSDADRARTFIEKAIRIKADDPFFHNNLGAVYRQTGETEKALECFRSALRLNPDYAEAAYNLGSILHAAGQVVAAIPYYQRAVELQQDYLEAYINMAAACNSAGMAQKAVECCSKALELSPANVPALNNMGNALQGLEKAGEALLFFRKAIALAPENHEIYTNMGNACCDLGIISEALSCYRQAIHHRPDYAQAYNNMGILMQEQGKYDEAAACYQRMIELKPDEPAGYLNMGNFLKERGQTDAAIEYYQKTLQLKDDLVEALVNLGVAYEEKGAGKEALGSYRRALAINPSHSQAVSHLVHQVLDAWDWKELSVCAPVLDRLTDEELAKNLQPGEMPFLNIARHAEPALNYAVASAWSRRIVRRLSGFPRFCNKDDEDIRRRYQGGSRITVGYLSNNFKNHPTAHLIRGLFRCHNRDKFIVHCYSFGEDDGSGYRRQIERECDKFIDISRFGNTDAARRIHEDGVGILVDLVGFMKGHRLGIAALRPAPVQVRWLGMAGTTGADFFDFIIADRITVAQDQLPYYSEIPVYMPHCYQINDNRQKISRRKWNRKELGLPQRGFVFCCFCSRYKFYPAMFDNWMQILGRVPGSVLWVLGGSSRAEENLRKEARRQGIAEDRLVFAPRWPKERHLSRLRLADLALDTRVVNGAATTSDALWAGVPVVTLKGNHFASRMSASILGAIGLQAMVADSPEEYRKLAVQLAQEPERLLEVRTFLEQQRAHAPLFDTPRFVRNLENAYRMMWKVFSDGTQPSVPLEVDEAPLDQGEFLSPAAML